MDPLVQPYAELIPKADDPDIKGYVPRQPDWGALCDAYADGDFVLEVGESGTGKTTNGKALAYALNIPWLLISCDGRLPTRELVGQLNIKNGTSFFTEGVFTKLSQVPSVIHLAEFNALDQGNGAMFFQEVTNNRRFFVKEADGGQGKVYHLHRKCFLLFDCNPPSARYTGTQRSNVASVDRLRVLNVQALRADEIVAILGPGAMEADKLADLYVKAMDMIHTSGLRAVVSIRGLKRAAHMMSKGYAPKEAVEMGVLNAIELTGGKDAREAVEGLAKTMFRGW